MSSTISPYGGVKISDCATVFTDIIEPRNWTLYGNRGIKITPEKVEELKNKFPFYFEGEYPCLHISDLNGVLYVQKGYGYNNPLKQGVDELSGFDKSYSYKDSLEMWEEF